MATYHEAIRLELNQATEITASSRSAAFGVALKGGDYKTLIMFTNATQNSATATIEVGDGFKGKGDAVVVTVGAGKTMGIVLDSAYFKNVSGEYKGYAVVTPSAALSVEVVELP